MFTNLNHKKISEIIILHRLKRNEILQTLNQYSTVPKDKYFYELCFCLCTPQSKAENAMQVQLVLEKSNFLAKPYDISTVLRQKENYIRFHNQKALRILEARENWSIIADILNSKSSNLEKRDWIRKNVKGLGMKESAHFLRNIGFRGLGILDRHILKNLVECGVFNDIPKISSDKLYLDVENKFIGFAKEIQIDIDELDLVFWSNEAGLILK